MYCPACGVENENSFRFCQSCGAPLRPEVQVAPPPTDVPAVQAPAQPPVPQPVQPIAPPPRPSGPLEVAALVGGIGGIFGGAASAIGWFMPWFGLGQLGQGLGVLGNLIGLGGGGGGIAGSGFQLMLLAIQVPSLVNASRGLFGYSTGYSTGADTGTAISLISILVALILVLIPILGLLSIRAGVNALQLRSVTDSISVGTFKHHLNALTRNSAIGFIVMVIIFILLAQIPFVTMLLSSGFFITGGGFALGLLASLWAKGQVRPISHPD